MKKKKLILLILGILLFTCAAISLTLYFTIWKTIPAKQQKNDLKQQNLEYLAKIEYMNKINEQEASIIKNEIQIAINNKLNKLNLKENIDYQIKNLNNIKNESNLNDFRNNIIIDSIENSTKATGSFRVTLNAQENITNRSIKAIEIDIDEEKGLNLDIAKSIKNHILIKVQNVLSQGQINRKDIDYQIKNLNLIKEGAKFDDYKNQISVRGISLQLTGEFPINFQLVM